MNLKRTLLIVLLIYASKLSAQKKWLLKVLPRDEIESGLIPPYRIEHKDSIALLQELNNLINTLHARSYIATYADSIFEKRDTIFCKLFVGKSYEWSQLRKGNLSNYLLQRVGYREKFYTNTRFSYSEFVKLEQTILKHAENSGYPFASVRLDTISFQDNLILASLNYQPGPLIVFDSIQIIGKTKIHAKFLSKYLRINKGQIYSQEKVDNIERLIKELPYIKQTKPPVIVFANDKAQVLIFVEDKKANQVDGIVGFLPNQGNNNKVLITGEVNLNLKNLFGSGKTVFVEWRKYNRQSQLLDASYFHPKFIGSNADAKVDINILKQDSLFVNITRRITLSQALAKKGKVNFSAGLKTSNKLSQTTDSLNYISFRYNVYGLGYDWKNLDDVFYPRKGWLFSLNGFIGNKTIQKDPNYKENFYALHNIQLKSTQLTMNLLVEKYSLLNKRSVLLLKMNSGKLFNNTNSVFINDLYRIGGLRTLRGFNENNFYASMYSVGTVEYRFFTDQTSYLLLFYDQGMIKNQFDPSSKLDYPFGLGTGVSFATGAGIFNFIYSVGKSFGQPLSLNYSKIHFGIISRF